MNRQDIEDMKEEVISNEWALKNFKTLQMKTKELDQICRKHQGKLDEMHKIVADVHEENQKLKSEIVALKYGNQPLGSLVHGNNN